MTSSDFDAGSSPDAGTVVRLGLLGCGTVGAALIRVIDDQAEVISRRYGLTLEVARVAVRDLSKARDVDLPDDVFTDEAKLVVDDPDIDLVVELIGGMDPSRPLILAALQSGKSVVTGNKELVADHGRELFDAAHSAGVDILFEAAVAGGIPLIRTLATSLAGEKIHRIMGIVNGTTNFILTKMTEEGADYGTVLAEAQRLGYAEADPTADVGGHDAAAKAAILAKVGFGADITRADVHVEGITEIGADTIAAARQLGKVIKLLAVVEDVDGAIAARVHPVMLPKTHPLATVRGSFNAVFIEGDAVGELMLYGRGAGGEPTASAVLGDIVVAADNRRHGNAGLVGPVVASPVRAIDESSAAYYVPLDVVDEPGVLREVAAVFGDNEVSIRSIDQQSRVVDHGSNAAHIDLLTHEANEARVQATIAALKSLPVVHAVGTVVRVFVEDE